MANRTTKQSTFPLVGNSGIQFLSFSIDVTQVDLRKRNPSWGRFIEHKLDGAKPGPRKLSELLPGCNETDPDAPPPFPLGSDDAEYEINRQQAFEPFIGEWVP